MELLKSLCQVHAPSGNEAALKDFLLTYIREQSPRWQVQPEIIEGPEWQDCLMLVFGEPRTAIFAHMDSVGFTVRYDNKLVPIGGPDAKTGYRLVGRDTQGEIEATLVADEEGQILCVDFPRLIDRGTELVFKADFRESPTHVQCCYLDNRLGVWSALQVAETLEHGVICFSCWEEHGGGSVSYLVRYLWERFHIRQALVSDITWVTEGVKPGKGVVISLRDQRIPRRSFLERVVSEASQTGVPYQLEVEEWGGSDGKEIQASPYPIDWCFIGAPEENVHSPHERVHRDDIEAMVALYRALMRHL
ncbi:Putative aminopeptidase FrvX [Catalinimonas alkaloidigena]|uniref:Putative aminopeptidase FrvX n=1 Tax=Catalinimonas alkaloidigena TaxID=1075417 RepID=A0A1G9BMG8_9BACT|nr:M20/M25/M40 family metallo-hydrolase [Catalinimonas alkaloidigena]SDK40603.1 Putative aminopeptidase FrvX [Catalinimonas alkaloidigena]